MMDKLAEIFNVKKFAIGFFLVITVLMFGLLFSFVAGLLGLDQDSVGYYSLKSLYTSAYITKDSKMEKVDISSSNTIEFNEMFLYTKESYATKPDGYLKSFVFGAWEGELTSDSTLDGKYLYIDFYTCEEAIYSDLIKEVTGEEVIEIPDLTSCNLFYRIQTEIRQKDTDEKNNYIVWDEYVNFKFASEGEYFLTHIYVDGKKAISNFNLYFYEE